MKLTLKILALVFVISVTKADLDAKAGVRNPKIFPLFNVVTFSNLPCNTSQTTASNNLRQGSCRERSECISAGGTASGNCAAGFGVCCLFTSTAASAVTQNCTYIRNTNFPSANTVAETATAFSINKCADNICRLRLDLEQFVLTAPTDGTDTCATDSMVITTASSGALYPTLCGTNTGEHIYIEVGRATGATATLTFTLGAGTALYEIKVSQIPCGANYSPPEGCFQYHTGTTGRIQTFNFAANGDHLQNQDYNICTRQEEGFCCIQYQQCSDAESFTLSNELDTTDVAIANNAIDSSCLADYITIDGASSTCTNPCCGPTVSRFCGTILNTAVNLQVQGSTFVCDCVKPFNIQIHTDAVDDNIVAGNNRGLCLDYMLLPC